MDQRLIISQPHTFWTVKPQGQYLLTIDEITVLGTLPTNKIIILCMNPKVASVQLNAANNHIPALHCILPGKKIYGQTAPIVYTIAIKDQLEFYFVDEQNQIINDFTHIEENVNASGEINEITHSYQIYVKINLSFICKTYD